MVFQAGGSRSFAVDVMVNKGRRFRLFRRFFQSVELDSVTSHCSVALCRLLPKQCLQPPVDRERNLDTDTIEYVVRVLTKVLDKDQDDDTISCFQPLHAAVVE